MEPGQRRGPGRSEAARLAILDAASRQFVARGYDALTMEGIAAEAKVGKQTIYRWWPTRTALIAECLAEGMLMPDWFVPEDTGDVRRDLTSWLQSVIDFIAQPGNEGMVRSLVVAAAEDANVARGLADRLGVLRGLNERMRAAAEAGELAARRLDDLVEALLGAVVVRVLSRAPLRADDAARMIEALLGPVRQSA